MTRPRTMTAIQEKDLRALTHVGYGLGSDDVDTVWAELDAERAVHNELLKRRELPHCACHLYGKCACDCAVCTFIKKAYKERAAHDSSEQKIQRLHKDLWLVLDCLAAHCEMTEDLEEDGPLMAQIRAEHPRDPVERDSSEQTIRELREQLAQAEGYPGIAVDVQRERTLSDQLAKALKLLYRERCQSGCFHEDIKAALAQHAAARSGQSTERSNQLEKVHKIVDLYFMPWGAAKAAQLEEYVGDGMFGPETILRKIQEILK